MNIYLILLLIIIFPLLFTVIVHITRLHLYKNIETTVPFSLFELPNRSQIINYKDSKIPHCIAEGLSKLNKESGSFELPIISGLSRINTYMVILPKSFSFNKLDNFLIENLKASTFKVFFKDEIGSSHNNLNAWKRFFKKDMAESKLMDKAGFKIKQDFLYLAAKSDIDNQYINFIGFHSIIFKKRMILLITFSSE